MMTALSQIICFSLIMWFVIDRFKPLWASYSWGKYLTLGISVALGIALAFLFDLDFIVAAGVAEEVTVVGHIFTGIILSAGASGIYELIDSLKQVGKNMNSDKDE